MEEARQIESRMIRIATGLFFFICVPLSIWESGVYGEIFINNNPVATAQNLLSNEFSFRATIISHFIGTVVFTIMALVFYRLLKPVNKSLSLLMIVPIVAQLAIVFVMETFQYSALMTLKSDPRMTLDLAQQQEVAYFLMRAHRLAFGADKIIFGLYFVPMGILVYRSGFAPRIIGVLIMIGGVGYMVDTSLYVLLQRADYISVQSLKLFSSATYALALLWFLIKGVRNPDTLNT